MPDRLNDLTREQIAELQRKSKRVERECLWCAKPVLMQTGQQFCCAAHRAAYQRAAAAIAHEELVRDRERWLQEHERFVREIAVLRALLVAAGIIPPEVP